VKFRLLALAAAALVACGPAPVTSQAPAPVAASGPGILPAYVRRVDAFPITGDSGRPHSHPFLGGLDRPRPQLADIDGDGDLDLFVQEYGGRMMFFERVAASGGRPARYEWRTDRWQGLDVGEWSRFVDLDGDGDLDLLAESPFSYIRWFRNDGGAKAAAFKVGADSLRDATGAPIFADRQNIPQIADLDCNGRLDLFLGRVEGSVARYEMEPYDAAKGPRFALVRERFEDILILGGEAAPPPAPGPSMHGANTMAVVDVDQDGDRDILWGDFFEPGLLWIRNTGTCASPSMRETPEKFPVGAPLATSGYNAPAVEDLDGDRDYDMLVGVIGGAFNPAATSRDNLYHLEQTGRGTYSIRTRRFLDGLDLGSETSAALADVDGDADLDIVVGTKIDPDNRATAGLYLLRNAGSKSRAAFDAPRRLDVAPAYHYAPAFGDLDGDGDQDMLLGTWRDAVPWYRNEGTGAEPRFVLADSALVRLTRGSHATPSLADLDGDGDLDLFVGEASGAVNFYRNDGDRTTPKFSLVSDEWEGITGARRSVPRPTDLDGDGDLDIVIGTEAGAPIVLRNTGTRTSPAFARDAGTTEWPAASAPAFGDLDGDGDLDVVLGNAGGGLMFLESASRKR
jgi:hypothetical protein